MTSSDTADSARCVLVIDDNEDVRILLEHQIRRLGHRVLQAADGQAGLDLAASARPDVILLDLFMPGIDGHAVMRLLTASGSSAAVVVMSGEGAMGDVIEALRAGAVDYLRKPFSVTELASAVERGLARPPR
ncbi:MAG TPA: response regulator [Polyangia bacterium]|nr:response regulator [Polyangia bacterium]